MKRIISIILIIISTLAFVGCGKITNEEYEAKESEFYGIFKEISKDLYPTALEVVKTNKINKNVYNLQKDNSDKLSKIFDNVQVPQEKMIEYELISKLNLLTIIHLGETIMNETVEEKDIKSWQEYIDLSKKLFMKYDENIDDMYYANNPTQKYIDERNITLTAKDVQYDMENNLDKDFVISGVAELDDYYNYGFDDIEDDYFCIQVTPDDGGYTESWYLYLHRKSFDNLFTKLKSGNTHIVATCKIPKSRYEKGQNNMAVVEEASW